MIDAPTASMLTTVVGISAVVTLLMSLIVRPALPVPVFDVWAPGIALVLGVTIAVLAAFARNESNQLVDALLVGLFAGAASQNVNTVVVRTVAGIKGEGKPA